MNSRDIQTIFTEFFAEWGHTNVPSSSLIPPSNDPTVLLTTAGMQQMTPYFLGLDTPPAHRMTSTQKCFRTVDIDEVGDETHLTFFEMLGNFSVGDYFKQESIRLGWKLLSEVYGIDPDRMTVTVYPSDDEARQLWINDIGLTHDRIFDDPGNIWGPVGDSGPCGPNSEIYVDRGAKYGCGEPECGPLCERCERHVEVWNHVFMQWFQEKDGSRRDLERKHIDTGMGLERITMVLQDAASMYDTDLFQPVIQRAAEISGKAYKSDPDLDRSMRVIADHGRAVTFLIADGVLPGNEGRGYVLRRILRRAVRHGRLLGIERPFLTEIADVVTNEFGERYPELRTRSETVRRVIQNEEDNFGRTLATGISRFDALVSEVRAAGETVIHGAEAFRLYDTYGFPFELTAELARDAGLEIDVEAFAEALEQSRARSRAAVRGFADGARGRARLYSDARGAPVDFVGYDAEQNQATITDILGEDDAVEQLDSDQPGEIVLDATAFYGESGGQVGDTGTITTDTGVFVVDDTQRPTPTLIVHRGVVTEGFIRVGQRANAIVDSHRRDAIRRNHTATHVLHRALRIVLGNETHQAGSLVAPDRLRFDFTSVDALGSNGMDRVTEIANSLPLQNVPVVVETMPYADAIEDGAMALFGEKYGDVVRVVKLGDYSAELCGGTHVSATGEIGPIVILAESSIGSGIRRIEALTGDTAIRHLLYAHLITSELTKTLHASSDGLLEEVRTLQNQIRERDRTIEQLRLSLATSDIDSLIEQSISVDGTQVLATRVPAEDRETMLQIGDRLRDKLRSGVIVLACEIDSQPALLAMVTKDQVGRGLSAGSLIKEIAPIVGGRGGGRPELAQGGGTDASKLDDALATVATIVKRHVSG